MEIQYCLTKEEIKDLYFKSLMLSQKHKRSIGIIVYTILLIGMLICILINDWEIYNFGVIIVLFMMIFFIFFLKTYLSIFTKNNLFKFLDKEYCYYLFRPSKIILNNDLEYIIENRTIKINLDSIDYIYYLTDYIIIKRKDVREIVIPTSAFLNKNDLDLLISYFNKNNIIIKKKFDESIFSLFIKNYYKV